jgi:hypothetical protein
MHREHQMHDPQLQSLIQICRSLHSNPEHIAEDRETCASCPLRWSATYFHTCWKKSERSCRRYEHS